MRIDVRSGRLRAAADAVEVVAAWEGDARPDRLAPAWASAHRELNRLIAQTGVRGALNEAALFPIDGRWVMVVGLGKTKHLSLDRVRQLAGTAAKVARNRAFRELGLPVLTDGGLGSADLVAQALTEGALLGLYRYDRFKDLPKHEKRKQIAQVTLLTASGAQATAVKRGAQKGQVLAESVAFVRDLISGPPNLITPTYLASEARAIARRFKLACTVIPFAELKRRGFGGLAGVAQGSAHPAQFIVLDYAPRGAKKTFALCGKGITFDSGGLSLKSAENMEKMKYDMSGAAAVLGTIRAAAMLKLPVRVIGIIAATENLPSGTAQRPGDVLKTLSGKTVEVINTDAEGRLVLADCLHYAKRYAPDCVVDIATLTGACVIALGSEAIGLLTPSDRLADRITASSNRTHERVWRMPLWDEYARLIKSDIADLKNTGGREGGVMTAAKFLQAFTDGLNWAHLDIAGTAWSDREKPYVPKGAVGIGVRLLIDLMEQWT